MMNPTRNLVATGSVADVVNKNNSDYALAFMNVKLIVLADRSGSMLARDVQPLEFGMSKQARYEVEDKIVRDLQAQHPGQILLASFGAGCQVHPHGVLPLPSSATPMLQGLKLAQAYLTPDIQVVLVSDGEPTDSNEKDLIDYVRVFFMRQLSTAFAGPVGSPGEKLLKKLSEATHGQHTANVLNQPLLLQDQVEKLLLTA